MPAYGAVPGLFLCFAATVLLVFVSVSSPTWEDVYFLEAGNGRGTIRFGVFGYTNSDTRIGYRGLEPLTQLGLSSNDINRLEDLSMALVLHPIAAGLGAIAVLFGVCGASYHRSGTVSMMLFAGLATLVSLAIWVIDIVMFLILRGKFRDENITSELGNAIWIALAAFLAFGVGFICSFCGMCASYRKKERRTTSKSLETQAVTTRPSA
ncbi:pali-domain-containing protein [Marasmius fiardii PR-910]|nr:pali-domain-containing protein [Marasmius fiardii PR-910]